MFFFSTLAVLFTGPVRKELTLHELWWGCFKKCINLTAKYNWSSKWCTSRKATHEANPGFRRYAQIYISCGTYYFHDKLYRLFYAVYKLKYVNNNCWWGGFNMVDVQTWLMCKHGWCAMLCSINVKQHALQHQCKATCFAACHWLNILNCSSFF